MGTSGRVKSIRYTNSKKITKEKAERFKGNKPEKKEKKKEVKFKNGVSIVPKP